MSYANIQYVPESPESMAIALLLFAVVLLALLAAGAMIVRIWSPVLRSFEQELDEAEERHRQASECQDLRRRAEYKRPATRQRLRRCA